MSRSRLDKLEDKLRVGLSIKEIQMIEIICMRLDSQLIELSYNVMISDFNKFQQPRFLFIALEIRRIEIKTKQNEILRKYC